MVSDPLTTRSESRSRWDIFCKVVDNYGDAGVCWRLARQLAAAHGIAPRLWVDRLDTLARLAPRLDPARAQQTLAGVDVRRWTQSFPEVDPGAVVLETFGCDVPAGFAARIAHETPQPIWINLEHLTAEAWADEHHRLPSPHPRLPITRWYFYPGFTPLTGGLLREPGLIAARDRFQSDRDAQSALWDALGLPPREDGELRVLLFCYDTPAATHFLDALAAGSRRTRVIVPEGVASTARAALFGTQQSTKPYYEKQGLAVHSIPFQPQEQWDRVLWACDVNVVRGEDSFVRAQWAGRPFLWAIYPQTDGAHRNKLSAFLERYTAGLDPATARAVSRLHEAWQDDAQLAELWADFAARRPAIESHNRAWADRLAAAPDLASKIIEFAAKSGV